MAACLCRESQKTIGMALIVNAALPALPAVKVMESDVVFGVLRSLYCSGSATSKSHDSSLLHAPCMSFQLRGRGPGGIARTLTSDRLMIALSMAV
jgi:hypothetical protein